MSNEILNFDYTKPSNEIITDLIFHSNGIQLDTNLIEFDDPIESIIDSSILFNDDISSNPINTKVIIKGLNEDNRSIRGESIIFYRRLSLSWLESNYIPITLNVAQIRSIDLIPYINLYYGISLDESDILDELLTIENTPYILKANPNSLVWNGSFKVNIEFANRMITVNHLNGFRDVITSMIGKKELSGFHQKHFQMLNEKYLDGF